MQKKCKFLTLSKLKTGILFNSILETNQVHELHRDHEVHNTAPRSDPWPSADVWPLTPPPEGSTTPPLRWAPREDRREVAIAQTAIVLIDMWCAALTTSATLAGALPLVVRRLTRAG